MFEIAAKFDMPDLELVLTKEELKFRIVGGHHRFDAAAYLGLEDVPVTVIMDDAFDEDQERFQLVRMNMIRGKLDPQAFFDLYNSLAPAYSDEVLQDAFGFADEAEFRKLIDQTAKALPDKNLQKKFKEAAEEIKTIDGLSKLLERDVHQVRRHAALRLHGVRSRRPERSMWLRIEGKTMNALDLLGTLCIDQARTVDDVIGGILQLAAKGELNEHVDKVIGKTPPLTCRPACRSRRPRTTSRRSPRYEEEGRRPLRHRQTGEPRPRGDGPHRRTDGERRVTDHGRPLGAGRPAAADRRQAGDAEEGAASLSRRRAARQGDGPHCRCPARRQPGDGAQAPQRHGRAGGNGPLPARPCRQAVDARGAAAGRHPLKNTTNEIRLLKDMLVDLGRVQMETGLLPRAAKTIKGTVTGADGQIKEFAWTEEQEELFKEIEELESAAARET